MATEIINPLTSVRKDIKTKILEFGVKKNLSFFLKLVPVKIKGFTDTKKAPIKLITKEFARIEIYKDPKISRELLKLWFEGMVELQELVRDLLKENDYEPIVPDFNSSKYKFNALAKKDVFHDETTDQSYFRPNGIPNEKYDPEEITLMAFLLGWHIDKSSVPEKNESNVAFEIIFDKIKLFENDLSEYQDLLKKIHPKIIKGEILIEENTKLVACINKVNNTLDEIKQDLLNLTTSKGFDSLIPIISTISSTNSALEVLDKIKELEENNEEIKQNIEEIEKRILCGRRIKHKENAQYKPIIACNEAVTHLIDDIETAKQQKVNINVAQILSKAQPIFDFAELAKCCPTHSLDEERLEKLLDIIKSNFGDVMKEYLFKKLFYVEDDTKPDDKKKDIEVTEPMILVDTPPIEKPTTENGLTLKESGNLIPIDLSADEETQVEHIESTDVVENETIPPINVDIEAEEDIISTDLKPTTLNGKITLEPSDIKEDNQDNFDKFSKDQYEDEFKESHWGATSLELTNNILSLDDKNLEGIKNLIALLIWKLITERPEIAYQISSIVEQEKLESEKWHLPSRLIRTIILNQALKYERRNISKILKSDFGFCNDLLLIEQEKFNNLALRILIFASVCRPYLLAPESEANQILYNLKINEYPKLQELINILCKFRSNLPLDIDLLRKHQAEVDWEENAKLFSKRIDLWVEGSRSKTYRKSNVINQVWRTWHDTKYFIGEKVNILKKANYSEISRIKGYLQELGDHDLLQSEIDKTVKVLMPKQPKYRIEPKAFEWIHERISEFEDILKEWIEIHSSNPVRKSNYFDHEIKTLYDDIENIKSDLLYLVDSILNDKTIHLKIKIAFQILETSFNKLVTLIQGNDPIIEEVEEKYLLNSCLLRIPDVKLDTYWNLQHSTREDLFLVLSIIKELQLSWDEIFKNQLQTKNYILTGWLILFFNKFNIPIDPSLIEKEQVEMRTVRHEELVFYINKVEDQIENGVALGFLNDIVRNSLVGELNSVKSILELNERFNYKDEIGKIESIKLKIDNEKQKIISSIIIPANIEKEARNRIEDILNMGDIYTTNELISRVTKGKPIEDYGQPTKNIFLDYYTKIIHSLFEYLNKTERRKEISVKLKDRGFIEGLDLAELEPNRANEASQLYSCWHNMQGDLDFEKNAIEFFEYLGFNGVDIERDKLGRRGDQRFFNIKCQPIKEKAICPVPAYGSLAKGHYRILTFSRSMVMEDLVKAVSEDESRLPIIVLFFNPMSFIHRKELSYFSRKLRNTTFLTIDETMILYLCSVKGSRLSTLFKLALPTVFLTPYITTGSNVPLEMFYGRKPEKKKIINQYETSFLYGGRQLGKTALLKEIQKEFTDPLKGHFAIMIDLKSELSGDSNKTTDFASVLIKELRNVGINTVPVTVPSNITIGKVLQYVKEWLESDHERRMLLFLDEADKFLEEDSKDDFRNVSKLKATMETTDKRFKVVFAGLHNVQRTTKLPNNPLAHLGEPICIGPLLDDFESLEARSLIKVPLESLGFVFESENLVNRILAQTNYYPSFIQVYCSNLLDYLYNLIEHSVLDDIQIPFIITERHVNEAFLKAIDWIKEKYKFTLGLDERYSLITHIIALGSLDNILDADENPTNGFSVSWIREQSLYYWSEGFSNRNSYNDINTLLLEMVGLGILMKLDHGSDRYALRTKSITNFLGDRLLIEKELLRDDRKIANEFAPNIFRVEYKIKNDDKWRLKSPITIYQYQKILESRNIVLVMRGNQMLGSESLQDFLRNKHSQNLFEFNNSISTIENYAEFLTETMEKREKEGITLIIVHSKTTFTRDWIELTIKKISKLTSTDSFVHVVFEVNPQRSYELLGESNTIFDELKNQGVEYLDLQTWDNKVVKEWLTDEGYRSLDFQQLERCTGNFHYLLDTFYKDTLDKSPQYWKEKLNAMSNEILNKESARKILEKCGLTLDYELPIKILAILSNDNQSYTTSDINFFLGNTEPPIIDVINRDLLWLTINNFIISVGDDNWTINPFISEVYKHCCFN